jgi:iron(II)-dependent oxidoreductase
VKSDVVVLAFALAFALALPSCTGTSPASASEPEPASPPKPSAAPPPVDTTRMALIPAGTYRMGHAKAEPGMYGAEWKSNELPQRAVTLSAFYIDRDEVTVREWARFVEVYGSRLDPHQPIDLVGGVPVARAGSEDLPITFVSWFDAHAFCAFGGKFLPREAEWERAAKGPNDDRRFPWGDDGPTCKNAVFTPLARCELVPVRTGSRSPAGDSVEGVRDLAGNAAEWVADWYAEYPGPAPVGDPTGPDEGSERVIRGGGVSDPSPAVRTTARSGAHPTNRAETVGFRCVYRP